MATCLQGSFQMTEFWWVYLWPVFWIVIKILLLVVPLLIGVAYLTYAERKVIGAMHLRRGPNVVGPYGLLQPIADGMKLFFKETITKILYSPLVSNILKINIFYYQVYT